MPLPPRIQEIQHLSPTQARSALASGGAGELFAPATITAPEFAELTRGALYLHHGFLEEAHRIFQHAPSPTGSYWHAILHRMEGDFANSKYWYHRARATHPVWVALGAKYDPYRLVDDWAHGVTPSVQQRGDAEFAALLDFTVRSAL